MYKSTVASRLLMKFLKPNEKIGFLLALYDLRINSSMLIEGKDAKKNDSVWVPIRPFPIEIYGSKKVILCSELKKRDVNDTVEECVFGDQCICAHNAKEFGVWSFMQETQLQFAELQKYLIENAIKVEDAPSSSSSRAAVPADAVRPGKTYAKPNLAALYTKNELFKITVKHVEDPNCFYFQLASNQSILLSLWEEMTEFYNSCDGDLYRVCEEDLAVGLAVAFLNEQLQWHRGRVVESASCDYGSALEYWIYDVDTGVYQKLKTADVRLMKEKFVRFSAQCLRGSLADVQPVVQVWSPQAKQLARTLLTLPRPLMAKFVKNQSNMDYIIVYDVSRENNQVNISDQLILNGVAKEITVYS